jgi:hypothetical protein
MSARSRGAAPFARGRRQKVKRSRHAGARESQLLPSLACPPDDLCGLPARNQPLRRNSLLFRSFLLLFRSFSLLFRASSSRRGRDPSIQATFAVTQWPFSRPFEHPRRRDPWIQATFPGHERPLFWGRRFVLVQSHRPRRPEGAGWVEESHRARAFPADGPARCALSGPTVVSRDGGAGGEDSTPFEPLGAA